MSERGVSPPPSYTRSDAMQCIENPEKEGCLLFLSNFAKKTPAPKQGPVMPLQARARAVVEEVSDKSVKPDEEYEEEKARAIKEAEHKLLNEMFNPNKNKANPEGHNMDQRTNVISFCIIFNKSYDYLNNLLRQLYGASEIEEDRKGFRKNQEEYIKRLNKNESIFYDQHFFWLQTYDGGKKKKSRKSRKRKTKTKRKSRKTKRKSRKNKR